MTNKLHCIMLIDDDESDNYYHKMILDEMNVADKIIVAEDGVEALKILKKEGQQQPDLIFLDINMPKMNGWEFLDEYKKLKERNKAKVLIVMLTTSLNPDDKKKSLEKYADDVCAYFNKPLDQNIVNEIVKRLNAEGNA